MVLLQVLKLDINIDTVIHISTIMVMDMVMGVMRKKNNQNFYPKKITIC